MDTLELDRRAGRGVRARRTHEVIAEKAPGSRPRAPQSEIIAKAEEDPEYAESLADALPEEAIVKANRKRRTERIKDNTAKSREDMTDEEIAETDRELGGARDHGRCSRAVLLKDLADDTDQDSHVLRQLKDALGRGDRVADLPAEARHGQCGGAIEIDEI